MTASGTASSLPLMVNAAREVQSGLEAAFDRCSRGLYRYFSVRTGGDAQLADDLMQQLWLQASRSAATVPEDQIEFWLRGIAKNLIRVHWRRQARRPAEVPMANPDVAVELARRWVTEELPPTILERKEICDQLLLAVTGLSNDEQELIIGHYFKDRSHAELAGVLGISERAVEGRMYRARQRLREMLQHLES